MSLSKKRKVDAECRLFQGKWSSSYLFTELNGKAVCLLCLQQVSVLKEYNVRRHYETLHADKYNNFQGQHRREKVNELLASLKKQQSVFTHSREISDAAVKASYLLCALKSDLDSQLKCKVKLFIAFSVAIDKSRTLQMLRNWPYSSAELMTLWPSPRSSWSWGQWQIPQQQLIFSLVGALDRVGVDWSRAVSLATDGAPSMIGKKAGVVTKFREKVQTANGGRDFWTFHCILHQEALCCKSLKMDNVMKVVIQTVNFIRSRGLNHRQFDSLLREKDHNYGLPYHTEVRWLSRGAVLRCFFELREEIEQFMEKKGKPVLEFQSTEWMQDLAFMVDVTEHLNNLNKLLQGRNKVVTQYYECVQVEAVIVGDATRRWWCSSLSLSERCVRDPTCRRHEASLSNAFRFLVNWRNTSKFFARHSPRMPLICPSTSNLK